MESHRTFVLLASQEDMAALYKASESGRRIRDWICASRVRRGDRLLVYIFVPEHKIASTAIADCDAWYDDETKRYRTTLRDVRWLKTPIARQEIMDALPDWRWTINCSTRCRVPDNVADWLWTLSERDGTADSISQPKKGTKATRRRSPKGAGFGRSESNRIVEQAAVALVTDHFVDQGYTVTSRESENVGYDLDVQRGTDVLHVEVKGVSGRIPEFFLTANERTCSEEDRAFRICVVTEATAGSAKIHMYGGKELHERYELVPITFRAEQRKP